MQEQSYFTPAFCKEEAQRLLSYDPEAVGFTPSLGHYVQFKDGSRQPIHHRVYSWLSWLADDEPIVDFSDAFGGLKQ